MRERPLGERQRRDWLVPSALLILVVLIACGKPMWRSPLPELSDEPLQPDELIDARIYAFLLAAEDQQKEHPVKNPVVLAESTLVLLPFGTSARSLAEAPNLDPGNSHLIARRWPDSVKAGFAAAFADYRERARQRHPVSPQALVNPGVRLGSMSPVECLDNRTPECDRISTLISLSPFGFNADSTYAVAYRETWCGPVCGTGIVLLFRRQLGKQWIVWSASVLWIS